MPRKTFETMNGLRGIAAIIVVMWHGMSGWFGVLKPSSGYLAVDLFFVLSGFVIAHAYEGRLKSNMTFKQFCTIRFIRLYPLYFLGTVIGCAAIVAPVVLDKSNTQEIAIMTQSLPFAIAMLPTPDFHGDDLYPLNFPAWSLFFEMIINLIYAASFKLWSTKNIIFLMFISATLLLTSSYYNADSGWGDGGFSFATLPFGFFRVFYSFPAGVLIYRVIYEKQFTLPHLSSIAIMITFPFILIWSSDLLSKIVMLGAIPLLVAMAAKTEPEGMMRSLCDALGKASYAIYAIHGPLIALVTAVALALGKFTGANSPVVGYAFLIAISPLALLIDKWFDTPVRAYLNRRFVHSIPREPAGSAISPAISTSRNPRAG